VMLKVIVAVALVHSAVCQRLKRVVRDGFDHLSNRQHAGSVARLLIWTSVLGNPPFYGSLPFGVPLFVFELHARSLFVVGLQVSSESTQCFAYDISTRSIIDVDIESHLTNRRIDVATRRVWRRPDCCTSILITQEREREFRLSDSICLRVFRSLDPALGAE